MDFGAADQGTTIPVLVDPPFLDFGSVRRTSPQVRTIGLFAANARTVQLRVEPPNPEVQLLANNVNLRPGQPTQATIIYQPQLQSSLGATLIVESCGGACPVLVPLRGRNQIPGASCQTVDAGRLQVGTCTNVNVPCQSRVDQQIIFRPGAVSGPVAGRTLSSQFVVQPLASFNISIEVCARIPGALEGFLRGTFRFPGGVEEGIDSRIEAVGVDVMPNTCQLDVPTQFNVGGAAVGNTNARLIALRNAGSARCRLDNFQISGLHAMEFSLTPPPGLLTILPGGTVDVPVSFTPSATGTRQAVLRFTSNDPNRALVSIPIEGQGRGSAPTRFVIQRQTGTAPQLPMGRSLTFTNNDDGFAREPIPFLFNFLGTAVTEVFVSTNGFISFSQQGVGSLTNRAIPATNNPNQLVAWFWDDLVLDLPGSVVTVTLDGTAPNRRFIIAFRRIRKFGGGGVANADTELTALVELHETSDEIRVHYGQARSVAAVSNFDTSLGWENATGAAGGSPVTCSPTCTAMDWPTNTLVRYIPM